MECDAVHEVAEDADLFIREITYLQALRRSWVTGTSLRSSPDTIAGRASVRRLLLGHLSRRDDAREAWETVGRSFDPDATDVATDGLVVVLRIGARLMPIGS